MSDLLEILGDINSDHSGNIWIKCKPITESAPRDIPEFKEITDSYWTGMIIIRTKNTTDKITRWFSIPYKNIRKCIGRHINGPFIIKYKDMDPKSKDSLLKDSNPVLRISNKSINGVYNWIENELTNSD